MYRLVGYNGGDRVERSHDAEAAIVIHAELAIVRTRIFPGYHEHGEAVLDQVFHQRILGREVEDIVFHDPGRHDEDRLGPDLVCRRRVLDQFDQAIAINDLGGRDGEVAANLEFIGSSRFLSQKQRPPIFDKILSAAHKIRAAFLGGAVQDLGVGEQEIGWGDHVEDLSRREFDHPLVRFAHPRHAGGGIVPPLLL